MHIRKASVVVAMLFMSSHLTAGMYEATTRYSDRETKPFNLMDHLPEREINPDNVSDQQLEDLSMERIHLNIFNPYIPRYFNSPYPRNGLDPELCNRWMDLLGSETVGPDPCELQNDHLHDY